jgi:hypothetical protein
VRPLRVPALALGLASAFLGCTAVATSTEARAPSGAAPPRVSVADALALPCTRTGMATAVMAFTALLRERRCNDAARLWLPKRRLPTPGFLWVHPIAGGLVRATRGAAIPAAARRWIGTDYTEIEVIQIDTRPAAKRPAASGYSVAWVRSQPGRPDSGVVLGEGKGVWDCEKRRLAMFVGSERSAADEATARAEISGRCGRRSRTTLTRYGQRALFCGPVR